MVNDEEFFLHLEKEFDFAPYIIEEIRIMWDELHEVTRLMFKAYYTKDTYSPTQDIKDVDSSVKNYFLNKKIKDILDE